MKPVLLFIVICCILGKNSFICAVVLQSVFFIAAILKCGIFSVKENHKNSNIRQGNVIIGALIIMSGFALSAALTLHSAGVDTPDFMVLSFLTVNLYLCFYSLLVIMHLHGKSSQKLKITTLICTLFPCITSISDLPKTSPVFYAILPILGSILLYIALAYTKKGCQKTPLK